MCLGGFDTQARSLVRTLDERTSQSLILFSSAKDYEQWKNADSSRQAHYEIFSKKKSLFKKNRKLDDKYLKLSEKDHVRLRAIREEDEEYYSDNIHGANTSVIVGSIAYPFEDEGLFISAIFGRASSCSYQTLHHLIGQIAYFSYMINAILNDLHQIQGVENNEFVNKYRATEPKVMELASELLTKKTDN